MVRNIAFPIMVAGLFLLYVSCNEEPGTNNKTTIPAKTETHATQLDSVKKTALSFYDWYIENVKADTGQSPIEIDIVEGENGKCRVDYNPYFAELRKLGTISEKFINREKERTRECAENIQKVDWSEFREADAYEYDSIGCDFIYYYNWIRSQEAVTGAEVEKTLKTGKAWAITLRFYYEDEGTRTYNTAYHPVVTVEREKERWMITKIE